MNEEPETVARNAAWLKSQRAQMDWSTTELADRARKAARLHGDPIKLSQQLISKFENGRMKSTPKWLGYVRLAILDELHGTGTLTEDFHGLRLPKDMEFYFKRISMDLQWAEMEGVSYPPVELNEDDVQIDTLDLSYGMGATYLDGDEFEPEKATFSRKWLRKFTPSSPQHLVSTTGVGDSMFPTLHDRDTVIVDRSQNRFDQGDRIWAVVFGGMGMLKRCRPLPDGTVRLMSDNPQVSDELATDSDLHVVGRVVAIARSV